jgi:hypothetical protein
MQMKKRTKWLFENSPYLARYITHIKNKPINDGLKENFTDIAVACYLMSSIEKLDIPAWLLEADDKELSKLYARLRIGRKQY